MGQIVFQATLGGQVAVAGPNTASSFTLTLPAATDTLVGKATTDTLTNKSISGSTNTLTNIANASLTNSSVTIGSTAISLGGTSTTLVGLTGITSSAITDSGLTSGRVTYAGASGLLSDSANFTYNGTALTVSASSAISGVFNRNTSSGATVQIQVVGGSVGTLGSDTGGNGIFDIAATSSMFLRSTGASSIMAFSTNNTEVMRILANGNVGIGTSSPSVALEVAGAVKLTNGNLQVAPSTTTTSAVTICTNTGGNFFAGLDNSTGGTFGVGAYSSVLYNGANTPMVFFTNATERMRIDSSGNLLLGTTSNAANSRMAVSSSGITIYDTGYRQMYMNGQVLSFFNGANEATLTNGGVWTNASDSRLKKNITNIKYGLHTVLITQPRSFERNDVEGNYIGFIAQELKEHIPEVVYGKKQLSVDYGSLVAVAFKAIQEQQALIESLTTRLTALENK